MTLGLEPDQENATSMHSPMLDHGRTHDVLHPLHRSKLRSCGTAKHRGHSLLKSRFRAERLSCEEAANHYADPGRIIYVPFGPLSPVWWMIVPGADRSQ